MPILYFAKYKILNKKTSVECSVVIMSETGSDGAKDVFFSHENIVRKKYPSHHSNPNLSTDTNV